jgi:hypothetical protein
MPTGCDKCSLSNSLLRPRQATPQARIISILIYPRTTSRTWPPSKMASSCRTGDARPPALMTRQSPGLCAPGCSEVFPDDCVGIATSAGMEVTRGRTSSRDKGRGARQKVNQDAAGCFLARADDNAPGTLAGFCLADGHGQCGDKVCAARRLQRRTALNLSARMPALRSHSTRSVHSCHLLRRHRLAPSPRTLSTSHSLRQTSCCGTTSQYKPSIVGAPRFVRCLARPRGGGTRCGWRTPATPAW